MMGFEKNTIVKRQLIDIIKNVITSKCEHAVLTHSPSEQEQGRPFRPLTDTGRSRIL